MNLWDKLYEGDFYKRGLAWSKRHKKLLERGYATHAFVVWWGASVQIAHVFSTQSAGDITKAWMFALLYSEIVAFPLSFFSKYRIWGMCHLIGAILVSVLLLGVILYG